MSPIPNSIGEMPEEVLAKVQRALANWRNSAGLLEKVLLAKIENPEKTSICCNQIKGSMVSAKYLPNVHVI